MSLDSPPAAVVYELTVVGRLGPVLRRMLAPYATAASESQTILRASPSQTADIVDLVFLLQTNGIQMSCVIRQFSGQAGVSAHQGNRDQG